MPQRSVFHRLQGDNQWNKKVFDTSNLPIEITGYSPGDVVEFDDGNRTFTVTVKGSTEEPEEPTTSFKPRFAENPSINRVDDRVQFNAGSPEFSQNSSDQEWLWSIEVDGVEIISGSGFDVPSSSIIHDAVEEGEHKAVLTVEIGDAEHGNNVVTVQTVWVISKEEPEVFSISETETGFDVNSMAPAPETTLTYTPNSEGFTIQ